MMTKFRLSLLLSFHLTNEEANNGGEETGEGNGRGRGRGHGRNSTESFDAAAFYNDLEDEFFETQPAYTDSQLFGERRDSLESTDTAVEDELDEEFA